MNNANEALGVQVAQAAKAAGQRDGAYEIIRRETDGLRHQLGSLERARAAGGMNAAQVDLAQHNLLATALARFQAIERSPADRLHNLLAPPVVVAEVSREAQAAAVIAEIRAAGATLLALADGSIEIHAARQVSNHLRERAAGLRAEIVLELRRNILLIPAPKHHAGVAI